ncbi:hypothetical protein OROMI_021867 [Orobanche minor]
MGRILLNNVENESGDESDESSEKSNLSRNGKIHLVLELVREQNATNLADKEPGDAIDKGKKVATATEKRFPTATTISGNFLKPTSSKLLKQDDSFVPSGSVAAYIALQERQKQNIEAEFRREDVGDTSLQNASEGEQVEAGESDYQRMRYQLSTDAQLSMDVQQSTDDQPSMDIQIKAVNRCSSCHLKGRSHILQVTEVDRCLTQARGNHIYDKRHVVPDDLKKRMLEYTSERFDIAPEGKKWVYKTLNSSWRTHKSRVKQIHYSQLDNDEERIRNGPDNISLEDFKLLKYWSDDAVKTLAEDNKARRNNYIETHTLGSKSLAKLGIDLV